MPNKKKGFQNVHFDSEDDYIRRTYNYNSEIFILLLNQFQYLPIQLLKTITTK